VNNEIVQDAFRDELEKIAVAVKALKGIGFVGKMGEGMTRASRAHDLAGKALSQAGALEGKFFQGDRVKTLLNRSDKLNRYSGEVNNMMQNLPERFLKPKQQLAKVY